MDIKTFGPVVGALLSAGAPTISTALQMAVGEIPVFGGLAGPLVGLAAPRVISMIAGQLGVNEPDAPPEEVAQKVVDTINADPDGAKQKLAELESEHTYNLATRDKDAADQAQQIALLTLDAGSNSYLARNWRPLTALGLGFFLAVQLFLPYFAWVLNLVGVPTPPLPEPRFDVTVAMVSGLLGLGVLRTTDKVQTAKAAVEVAKVSRR